MDKLLDLQQAAEALCVSRATIRAWQRRGKIGYVRLGRAVRFPEHECQRLVQEGYQAPKNGPA